MGGLNMDVLRNVILGFFSGIAIGIVAVIIYSDNKDENKYIARDAYVHRIESKYSKTREDLAIEVEKYINYIAPTSLVDPLMLVDLCSKYNVDIRFVLAQGQVESHFGTKGTAKRTNSVFNVKAYDNLSAEDQIKKGYGFQHPNESIEPYLKLLTDNYLCGEKTVEDLLIKFVNSEGKRYASNPKYEQMLINCMDSIDNMTNISNLQDEYNMYKIQLGL